MKDKNVIFRCDEYEMSLIKALPYVLEEYMPLVSDFNRTRSLNYAVAFCFTEIAKKVYEENKEYQEKFNNLDDFKTFLLNQASSK